MGRPFLEDPIVDSPPPEAPQRRYHRVVRRRPVVVTSSTGDTTCAFARMESVGRGGALLLFDRPLPIGSELELTICLAGGVIRTRARVLYHLQAGRSDDEEVGLGVEFLDVDGDDAKLLDHLTTPTAFEFLPGDPAVPAPLDT